MSRLVAFLRHLRRPSPDVTPRHEKDDVRRRLDRAGREADEIERRVRALRGERRVIERPGP